MRRFIITGIIFVVLAISLIIIVNAIDWGRFGIGLLKRSTGYEILYEKIEGSIFRGYEIQNYVIRLSSTDSIIGRYARISYRLLPLSFRLPTIFQINLLEPVIFFKQKEGSAGRGKISILNMNLSLRINVKNGRIIYENQKTYVIEHISGLIFIDFLGKDIFLSTMNLSFECPGYPVNIYSTNLLLNINAERFESKSFQIKGRGFYLHGSGIYLIDKRNFVIKIKSGEIDLNDMKMYQGKVDFQGEVNFTDGKFIPKIQGSAQGIYFLDRLNFESNILADTTIINIFEGQTLNGNFSAQIKLLNFKNYTIETNFRNIDLKRLLKTDRSILINGKLGLKGDEFFGIINSPVENGLAIETLYVSGIYRDNHILVDTLRINEKNLNLLADGAIYPEYDLNIDLYNLNLEILKNFYDLNGFVSGTLHLAGKLSEIKNTEIDANLKLIELKKGEFYINNGLVKLEDFVWKEKIKQLTIGIDSGGYKRFYINNALISLNKENFSVIVLRNNDTLLSKGKLFTDGTGMIDSFILVCHKKNAYNLEPIPFDIFNKKLGDVHLKLANGEMLFSLTENKISIFDIELEKLCEFLGIKEQIKGKLALSMEKNVLSINAESIFYRGMDNGRLSIKGKLLRDNNIEISQLNISDDNNQSLDGYGKVSMEQSKLHLNFKDIRPWIFPFLNSFMKNPDGLLSGEVDFEGNFKDFKITGNGEIKNATFGINAISARFDSGYARIKFFQNQIIFEEIKSQILSGFLARTDIRSRVTGGGIIKLEPRFNVHNLYFDFSFKDAPLQYQNYAYGIGSGNFSISMKDRVMYYNGNIKIKEGVVPVDFGTYLESYAGEEKQEWRMNLKLSGDRNIWLRNRDADIEFGGEVYIIKEQTPLYISGNLETKRGNYYWLNHILKITKGKITFVPQEVIDPELDFWAELNTRERDPETNQEIKIILHCTGNISEPIFEFFSEPPRYSEQDILTYLNLNITWHEIESMKQGEYVGRVLPKTVLAYLESDVSRRLRAYTGLDYFRIETPLFEPTEKTKVTVGKYVSRNLFVTYTYDITSYSNEFNVEYFIDDRNEILIKRDETGEYSLQYQYRIRF